MKYLIVIFLYLIFGNSLALTLNMSANQTFESTSNIYKVSDDASSAVGPLEENINTTAVRINLEEDSAGLMANVELNVNYLDFERNVSHDVTRISLKSDARWIIRSGRYSWYFRDTLAQTKIDTSLSLNEGNTQDVNELVVGPEFGWGVSGNVIKLDAYLNKYEYSETDNDNSSVTTNLVWSRAMAGGKEVLVKYTTKVLMYDSGDGSEDYDQSTIGIGFKYKKRRDQIDCFLGKSALSNDGGDQYTTASFFFKRKMSRLSDISMKYSDKLSDNNNAIDVFGTPLSGVFKEKISSMMYQKNNNTSGYIIKYEDTRREDSVTNAEDVKAVSELSMYMSLSVRSKIDLTYSDTNSRINTGVAQGYENNLYMSKFSYFKKLNKKVSIQVFFSEEQMMSTVALYQYFDQRVGVSFSIAG